MKAISVSINRPMDKENVVYIYTMEYYSGIRKNEILPFATSMDLGRIMLSEVSEIEKDKYCMISFICVSILYLFFSF